VTQMSLLDNEETVPLVAAVVAPKKRATRKKAAPKATEPEPVELTPETLKAEADAIADHRAAVKIAELASGPIPDDTGFAEQIAVYASADAPQLAEFRPVVRGRGPGSNIPRDQWKRPLILPPPSGAVRALFKGKDRLAYWSASSLGDVLKYKGSLTDWQMRKVLEGASHAPHLLISARAFAADRERMNELVEEALTVAGANARSMIGTAVHKFCEDLDDGLTPDVPDAFKADVAAYAERTRGWEYAGMEQFVVCDELLLASGIAGAAGSFDRLRVIELPDGSILLRIVDIKTSGTLAYSHLTFGVQFAVYAWGVLYDPETGERRPLESLVPPKYQDGRPVSVDREIAEIVYVPAGEGRCSVHPVKIHQAWPRAIRSVEVRDDRNACKSWITLEDPDEVRHLAHPIDLYTGLPVGSPAAPPAEASPQVTDPIVAAIAQASTPEEIGQISTYYAQWWTPAHTELANGRWALLMTGAVA
jgi:hypothetical protein